MLTWDRLGRRADGGRRRVEDVPGMSPVLLFVGAFVAMEGVSYAAHRWVMHGFGLGWHRSHHAPADEPLRAQRPASRSASRRSGVLLFRSARWASTRCGGSASASPPTGVAYLFVHEVYIHHRLPVPRAPRFATSSGCATRTATTTPAAPSPTACSSRVVREPPHPTRERSTDPLDRGVHPST